MAIIPLPSSIEVQAVDGQEHRANIIVKPCYPGYGTTIGNALRRVLLSSLPGAAVSAVKIKGVDHEFSTMEHLKEDIVEIILNLKGLRFVVHSDEPVELELNVTGEKVVTAADFTENSQVEVVNKDLVIANLTDKAAELSMKVTVEKGRGYVPVEERDTEGMEVGAIAIDSVFTPVRNVNYKTEHVRVGQMTNFDKLVLDITTDGTVTPEDAFAAAAEILVEQFSVLTGDAPAEEPVAEMPGEIVVEEMSADEEEGQE